MVKQYLEVTLSDKMLTVNGSKLSLDDSLFAAEVVRVRNSGIETALELRYDKREEEFHMEEGERVYLFLIDKGISDKVEVYSHNENFSTVSLVGDYDAVVCS
jgi:hypothetical protein